MVRFILAALPRGGRTLIGCVLLVMACTGCAALPRVRTSHPEPNATLDASVASEPTRASQVQPNEDSGGNPMTQTTTTRGQFELRGGQGRIVNGFVRIPAQVRNHSAEWADVVVDVELLDADGRALVNRAATNAGEQMRSPYAIPPGGQMYYLYLRDVERLNGQYASYRLTLNQGHAVDPSGSAQVIVNNQIALKPVFDGAPAYLVLGTVTSVGGCAEPLVVAAGFDAGGQLLDVAEALVYPSAGLRKVGTDLSELAAGATGHFTLEFLVPGIQFVQARCVCL